MSEDAHEIIRTKELRLIDADGRDRAVLSSTADGAVALAFMDNQSKTRTRVGINAAGHAMVELSHAGETEKQSFSINVESDGRVLIELFDGEGIERFKLELKGNGSHTEMSFHEKHRKPRMVLMAEDKGPAGLFIMDQNGKALFSTTP